MSCTHVCLVLPCARAVLALAVVVAWMCDLACLVSGCNNQSKHTAESTTITPDNIARYKLWSTDNRLSALLSNPEQCGNDIHTHQCISAVRCNSSYRRTKQHITTRQLKVSRNAKVLVDTVLSMLDLRTR